jgi:hypothetical protein
MKKQTVDTPYKGSWADTMKTTDWKKLQPKPVGVYVRTITLEEYRMSIGFPATQQPSNPAI